MATEKTIYKYYTEMPPWAKGIAIVGTLTGLFFGGKALYNAIKKRKEEKSSREAIKAVEKDLQALMKNGIVPNYSIAQYQLWASAAEECYQGWGTCTGDTIFMNMKNDADLLMLIKAFDVRTITSGFWNPTPDTTGDLAKIIRSELDESQIEGVNKALAKNGLTYRF